MRGVSLRLVVTILLIVVAGGMVAVIVVGGKNAVDGVADVCKNLRIKVSDGVTAEVVQIMRIPFTGMDRAVAYHDTGAINLERWDARDHYIQNSSQHATYYYRLISQMKGWGNNIYTANAYGNVLVWYTSGMIGSTPPLDQIIEGNPTWTIPCRYQSNCTDPSNSMNHQYCVDQTNPFAGEIPPWARGEGEQKNLSAYYAKADPEWATWAVPQHATSASPTHCRANAQSAKPMCPDGVGCPEANFTYFDYNGSTEPTPLRGFQHFDSRMRWWYQDTKLLPPKTKYYNAVKLCVTTRTPCLTATMPLHVEVPSIGAVVRTNTGHLGTVLRYVHTLKEMHTPVLSMPGGTEEVWGRKALTLACNSSDECAPLNIPFAPQTTTQKFWGVVASDYYSRTLADIGASFKVSKTGGVFIGDYTSQALLLTSGFPCPEVKFDDNCFIRTVEGKTERVSAFDPYAGEIVSGVMTELFNPVVVDGVLQSQEHVGVVEDLDEAVSFGGSEYWVRFVPLSPRMGDITNLNWFVCVVIPQDDYLADIKRSQMVTLAVSLCLVAVVLATLLVLTIVFVVRPVMLLLSDFDKASVMELDSIEERSGGVVSEFASLQQTFNTVVKNLRLYRPFLPLSCFGISEDVPVGTDATPSQTDSEIVGSDVSTGSSRVSSVASQARKHVLASQVAAHLKRNKVTVVSASIEGFTTLAMKTSSGLRGLHAELLTQMLHATGRRCMAEPFTGDRMRFTWNALVPCRDSLAPFAAACHLAQLNIDAAHPMHVGVAKGDAVCGTMGTDTMKNFCVMGPCHTRSLLLMSFVRHYKTGRKVLIDGASASSLMGSGFDMAFIDVIRLGVHEAGKDPRTLLWSLEQRAADDEEWMYAMRENPAAEEWLLFLSGGEKDTWETERIKGLVATGVKGADHVGTTPSAEVLLSL